MGNEIQRLVTEKISISDITGDLEIAVIARTMQ